MNESPWQKNIQPPEDGWARLQNKIQNAEDQDRREIKIWRTLSVGLSLTLVLISRTDLTFLRQAPPEGASSVHRAGEFLDPSSALPTSSPNVHFYWLLR